MRVLDLDMDFFLTGVCELAPKGARPSLREARPWAEAFEIYMYATNAWDEPIYGENYVYYETTETLVEPFETAFSEYVTMPRADEISRVYAGIHRVRYDNGDIVEAEDVVYHYWDID